MKDTVSVLLSLAEIAGGAALMLLANGTLWIVIVGALFVTVGLMSLGR